MGPKGHTPSLSGVREMIKEFSNRKPKVTTVKAVTKAYIRIRHD